MCIRNTCDLCPWQMDSGHAIQGLRVEPDVLCVRRPNGRGSVRMRKDVTKWSRGVSACLAPTRPVALGLLVLGMGCAGPSRNAPTPPANVREALSPASSPSGVFLRPDAVGLRASFRTQQPKQVFRFDDDAAEIRKETWKVLGAGLSLVDAGVAATIPVSSFDISIAPDSKAHDRVYPALTRAGEGWMIYAPHLHIEGEAIAGRLSIEVPSDWTVVGRRDATGALVGDGYVFAGPSAYVHRGAADVVSAPGTPSWLLREIDQAASKTAAFYERRLGVPLREHPTILVAHQPERQGSFHGDTTSGAMMSLRFYGSGWNERDPAASERLADFVDHELFHFWNGELAHPSSGHPWLHEGGANYAALLASRERGTMSQERFSETLNRHLERCQAAQGNRDLRTNGPKGGFAVYACGTVFQWAIDIGLRKTSNGQRDVLSWWKDVLAKAQSDGGTYSVQSSFGLIGPEAARAASVLLDGSDERTWAAFAEAVGRYGVPLVLRRKAESDLASGLSHVLAIHCGRNYGFFPLSDHVKLDTGDHCGPLNGVIEVDSVAGFNPVSDSSAMYDKVRQLCASQTPIDFRWKGKLVARVPCTTSLREPTMGWQIPKGSHELPVGP